MKLSIIIPCYNEPDTIEEIVARVLAAPLPTGWEREVIVVDDGSREPTKEALRNTHTAHPEITVITRPKNGGKGAALKDGFAAATGDYLIVQDADLEYDPVDIAKLLAPIDAGQAAVVFGSRQMEHNNVPGRFYYYWGGRAVNILFNLAFGTNLSDITTCYKVFPRRLVPELLAQPSNDFVFDGVEFSRVLARERLADVAIHYHARDAVHGKKLKTTDGIRFLMRIISLGFAPYARIIRFVIVGGSAAALNILVLYVLTGWLGVWYLASEVIAFIIALCYNYALQKFWTFGSTSTNHARQGAAFVLVNILNLALNTAILFGLVEYTGLHYLLAQVIASLLIAFESYFLYRAIFR